MTLEDADKVVQFNVSSYVGRSHDVLRYVEHSDIMSAAWRALSGDESD